MPAPRSSRKKRPSQKKFPIEYWSHSSLLAYLRNPLAWYKRYVKKIYDTPKTPAAIVGTAGHLALENFYRGIDKEESVARGLAYVRAIPDFEINFGTKTTAKAKKQKRESMEREYLQAIGFYLARPPRYQVLGVEVRSMAKIPGLPLPVKAISDLVVESKTRPGAVDIVDHKFVDSFSKQPLTKSLFLLQAIFNYYTVGELYERPVARFIVIECKKTKNADGKPQLRKYVIEYAEIADTFELFHRLLKDATLDIASRERYLPNPSDMFEGDDSFEMYRLRLIED
jgi:hypothetical protein